MLQRVIRNRSFTLYKTFYVDGVAADPTGTPTVTVTRDDGTAVSTGNVTDETAAGTWSVTVPASANTLLDSLTVTWSAVVGGETQQYVDTVEVAGGAFFSLADARAVKPLDNTTTYPAERIVEARTMVETALEDACGVAFVPRYGKRTIHGPGTTTILLPPRTTAIRSVKIDGVASTDTAAIKLLPSGEAYWPAGWTRGYANIEVAFEHGYAYPPPRVSQAALLYAKNHLVKGPIDDRMTSMSTEDGTFSMATPGMRGSTVGIPEVDAVINQYGLSVAVA